MHHSLKLYLVLSTCDPGTGGDNHSAHFGNTWWHVTSDEAPGDHHHTSDLRDIREYTNYFKICGVRRIIADKARCFCQPSSYRTSYSNVASKKSASHFFCMYSWESLKSELWTLCHQPQCVGSLDDSRQTKIIHRVEISPLFCHWLWWQFVCVIWSETGMMTADKVRTVPWHNSDLRDIWEYYYF